MVNVAAAVGAAVPAGARQTFPKARIGGWMRGALRNQYAVENPQSNRWSQQPLVEQSLVEQSLVEQSLVEQPLVEQPLVEQPLVERRVGRGIVMSGRKWNPSV